MAFCIVALNSLRILDMIVLTTLIVTDIDFLYFHFALMQNVNSLCSFELFIFQATIFGR